MNAHLRRESGTARFLDIHASSVPSSTAVKNPQSLARFIRRDLFFRLESLHLVGPRLHHLAAPGKEAGAVYDCTIFLICRCSL